MCVQFSPEEERADGGAQARLRSEGAAQPGKVIPIAPLRRVRKDARRARPAALPDSNVSDDERTGPASPGRARERRRQRADAARHRRRRHQTPSTARRPWARLLDTRALEGISSYEPSELVVTARCGTPLAKLEATLAEQGQCLPFEPPQFAPGGTVGGMVAAGLSGPRARRSARCATTCSAPRC